MVRLWARKACGEVRSGCEHALHCLSCMRCAVCTVCLALLGAACASLSSLHFCTAPPALHALPACVVWLCCARCVALSALHALRCLRCLGCTVWHCLLDCVVTGTYWLRCAGAGAGTVLWALSSRRTSPRWPAWRRRRCATCAAGCWLPCPALPCLLINCWLINQLPACLLPVITV